MTHKHSSPIVVQAFAAPFARYPGYVISATRYRDQHVIVIVLTRPASTDSRLVHKLAHAQHHAAPPNRRQNNVKNVTGRKIGVDRPWYKSIQGMAPAYLCNEITLHSEIAERTTRSVNDNNVFVPYAHLGSFKNSFTHRVTLCGIRYPITC